MNKQIVLASASGIRRRLLSNAGLTFRSHEANIEEEKIKSVHLALGAEELALKLASAKAAEINVRFQDSFVIGCDQILDFNGTFLNKPTSETNAVSQLSQLSGKCHTLCSAVVVFESGCSVWQTVRKAHLTMRALSKTYIDEYVEQNWHSIRYSVGCYRFEEEGIRLFSNVEGDYFTILGLPLVDLLGYFAERGLIET